MNIEDKYKSVISKLICPWLNLPFGDQIDIKTKGKDVVITLIYPVEKKYVADLTQQFHVALESLLPPDTSLKIYSKVPTYKTQILNTKISNVKNVIAVSSGKGGVGKTTTACHLAAQLSESGYRVGLFDADIYGPNVPIMMGTQSSEADATDGDQFLPVMKNDIATMSLAYLVDADKPMVWRGPILSKTLLQILMQTKWPQLDFLILDLPPGTGDTQLTLAQKIPIIGAISVATPHPMAQADALKGVKMFAKVSVPMLGYINNMALHTCDKCGHQTRVWSSAVKKLSSEMTLLGDVPFDAKYSKPIKKNKQDDCFSRIVTALIKEIVALPDHPTGNIPTIVTE